MWQHNFLRWLWKAQLRKTENRDLRLVTRLLKFEAPGSVVLHLPVLGKVETRQNIRILTYVEFMSPFYKILVFMLTFILQLYCNSCSLFSGSLLKVLRPFCFWHSHCKRQLLKLTPGTVSRLDLDCKQQKNATLLMLLCTLIRTGNAETCNHGGVDVLISPEVFTCPCLFWRAGLSLSTLCLTDGVAMTSKSVATCCIHCPGSRWTRSPFSLTMSTVTLMKDGLALVWSQCYIMVMYEAVSFCDLCVVCVCVCDSLAKCFPCFKYSDCSLFC